MARPGGGAARGREAKSPGALKARGWKDVLWRTKREIGRDNLQIVAAACAYYAMLAIFPGIIALVSIYGLISDPAQVEQQVASLSGVLPASAMSLVKDYLHTASSGAGGALGWGTIIGIAGALWSASSGVAALMKALNIAYDEQETRGFFKVRGVALLLTLGFVAFVVASVFLIAVLPALLGGLGLEGVARKAIALLRWPFLALAAVVGLGLLYRYAPDRTPARWRWVSWGSVVATLLWIGASLLFSLYASNIGSFGKTYGALASVIVLLLWFFLSALAILVGAELNSEAEAQTRQDSTRGEAVPMGKRAAKKADTLGDPQPSPG